MCSRWSVTDGDEHAQLALAGVLGVDVELHGEAGRDAAGQARTARSHFAGVVGRQNPELEGAADMQGSRVRGHQLFATGELHYQSNN